MMKYSMKMFHKMDNDIDDFCQEFLWISLKQQFSSNSLYHNYSLVIDLISNVRDYVDLCKVKNSMQMNNDYICISNLNFVHDMFDDDYVLRSMLKFVDIVDNKIFEIVMNFDCLFVVE